MSKGPTNSPASVRQRLLNLSRQRNEDFQLVLIRYAAERLLYRLGQSSYANDFVLKGAMLFSLWADVPHRATLDLDLAGFGDDDMSRVLGVFREVCELAVEPDGLVFDTSGMTAEQIRDEQQYGGVRLKITTTLGTARIPVRIDIGFGDAITPDSQRLDYPAMLDLPGPRLWTYPKETVLAEKLQIMTTLGIGNSRMKDFFDLWVLIQDSSFDGRIVAAAIKATFERRGTPTPITCPMALGPEFTANASKQAQWRGFLNRGRLGRECPALDDTTRALATFFEPVLNGMAGTGFDARWSPGGPWLFD
ncbi:MAG TPA: nucleotidyl transferase AbiEii/AbiGii toxin family protein [Phycisphaerae bacterium]|nr:nucleotidyl transferase AbiEii/AbiGii toxin family protein [Phycisphaerae bacterium]